MARDKVEFDVIGRDAGGSKAFRQVGDAAERAGDQIEDVGKKSTAAGSAVEHLGDKTRESGREADDAGDEYRGLAVEIAAAQAAMRALAGEIDRTGNKDLVKDLNRQRSELRKLTRIKDLLPGDSETTEEAVRFGGRIAAGVASGLSRAGGPISAALSNVFGALPPQAQAAVGAGVVGAVAAAAPGIGAVLSGAVVGAAGVGGIVGGVVVAAQHPQVKAAAKLTGDAFAQEMQRGAVSFVPATVEALGVVRSQVGEIGEDWERASSAASTMLVPLTRDVLVGAEAAVDGFADAVERAGPVVDVLGDIARDAGELVGETFEKLSEHAYEGSRALAALWGVFSTGVSLLVGTVAGLTATYGLMEKFGALLIGDRDKLVQLIVEEQNAKSASGGLSEGLQELIDGFGQTGDKAAVATVEVETLSEAIRRMAGENITAEQANIRLEEAINRATEAGKANNAGITANTPKALANRQALLGIAEAANTSSAAIFAQTNSHELASVATERGRKKFLEAAAAMGVEKGEALRLANQLFAIPEKVDTKIMVRANTQPALDSARGIVARINNMHARIQVSAEPSGGYGGSAHTGDGYSTGMRWGGVVEHAQDGLLNLRQAGVYSPQGPARYAFAEPATGGEAFVPRNGDRGRSLTILSKAAGWYGAHVVPAGTAPATAAAGVSADDLFRAMVRALQTVPVARLDAGRTADIYSRGG